MQQVTEIRTDIGKWTIYYDYNKRFLLLDHPFIDINNITFHQRYLYSGINLISLEDLIENLLEIRNQCTTVTPVEQNTTGQ